MKKKFLIFCLVLLDIQLMAQPVFDFTNIPNIGDLVNAYEVNDTVYTFQISTGANKFWNFGSLSTSVFNNISAYVNPANTPFFNDFPDATLAIEITYPMDSIYNYSNISLNYYEALGYVQVLNGNLRKLTYLDKLRSFVFPFNYQDIHSDSFESSTVDSNNTTVYNSAGTMILTAVGYGTLTIPSGTYTNTILLKRVINSIDTSFIGGVPISIYDRSNTSYSFYSSSHPGSLLLFSYDTILNVGSGSTFSLYSASVSNIVTSIYEEMDRNEILIFPNPSLNTIAVNVTVSKPINEIALYDLCGKQMPVVLSSRNSTTQFTLDVSSLAGGTYIIKAIGRENIYVKRLFIAN